MQKLFYLPFAVFFVYLSQRVHWSDSELWSIGLAKIAFRFENAAVDYKFIFNLVLNALYRIPLGNFAIVQGARFEFALVGLATAGLVVRLSFLMTKDLMRSRWTLFLFCSSVVFLFQGFKVRSDLLATLLQLAVLVHFVRMREGNPSGKWNRLWADWGGLILTSALFLTTPKAVFHFLVNLTFILVAMRGSRTPARDRVYLRNTFLLPLLGFIAIVILKRNEFASAFEFFLGSYREAPHHPPFWSFDSAQFILDALVKSSPLVALLILGLPFLGGSTNPYRRALGASSLVALFLIFFHSDRLPFFIYSLLPLPILLAAESSFELRRQLEARSEKAAKIFVALAAFAIVVNSAIFVQGMLERANNRPQVQAQERIEKYVQDHYGFEYSDGTAVLPRDNQSFVFPAPLHEGNAQDIVNLLDRPKLMLFFFSNRMFLYFNQLYAALEERFFIQVGEGVFVRSYAMRSTHVMKPNERREICAKFENPKRLYLYEGAGFLKMRLKDVTLGCDGDPDRDWPKLVSTEPFFAFTSYEPLEFADGQSFARIFDHRPMY